MHKSQLFLVLTGGYQGFVSYQDRHIGYIGVCRWFCPWIWYLYPCWLMGTLRVHGISWWTFNMGWGLCWHFWLLVPKRWWVGGFLSCHRSDSSRSTLMDWGEWRALVGCRACASWGMKLYDIRSRCSFISGSIILLINESRTRAPEDTASKAVVVSTASQKKYVLNGNWILPLCWISRSRITPESLTIRIHGFCSNLQPIELIYIILKHSRLIQSEYPFRLPTGWLIFRDSQS